MGWLAFIIFGIKQRTKDHGPAYPADCDHCNNAVWFLACKSRRWFHLFWIPIIPFRAERGFVCPICNIVYPLEKSEFKRATSMASIVSEHDRGELTDREFRERLNAEQEALAAPDD